MLLYNKLNFGVIALLMNLYAHIVHP